MAEKEFEGWKELLLVSWEIHCPLKNQSMYMLQAGSYMVSSLAPELSWSGEHSSSGVS